MNSTNEFPLTRFDPGQLPEAPEYLNIDATAWWYRLAAWANIRCSRVNMDMDTLEDVACLMASYETAEAERDKEIALMNVNYKMADCGFCSVDMDHLNIPVHKTFREYRQRKV